MATPALRALRRGRPGAEIRAVLRASARRRCCAARPGSTRFVAARHLRRSAGRSASCARGCALARELRGADLAIVLPNSFASALLALRVARASAGSATRAAAAASCSATRCRRRARTAASRRWRWSATTSIWCGRSAAPTPARSVELFLEPDAERECDARFAAARISRRSSARLSRAGRGLRSVEAVAARVRGARSRATLRARRRAGRAGARSRARRRSPTRSLRAPGRASRRSAATACRCRCSSPCSRARSS